MSDTPDTLPWARSRRIALREFGPGDRDAVLRMHRDARLRALLVDDYPLDDPRVAQLFLDRMALIYRQHEGLGIWHASLIGPQPAFAGWFDPDADGRTPRRSRDRQPPAAAGLEIRAWPSRAARCCSPMPSATSTWPACGAPAIPTTAARPSYCTRSASNCSA